MFWTGVMISVRLASLIVLLTIVVRVALSGRNLSEP
jgi:hypothetical protein